MAELKLGQNIHRNNVPVRLELQLDYHIYGNRLHSNRCKKCDMPDKLLCKKQKQKKPWHVRLKSVKYKLLVTHQSWQTHQSGRQIH